MSTRAREFLLNGAHLAVLCAFAVSQPLLDILARNPTFFAVRESTAAEIVLFTLALVIVPPALLLSAELALGLASPTAARALHLLFVAALLVLVVLHALTQSELLVGTAAVVAAIAVAAAATALYARASVVRSLLSVLTPAPLVFAALFLFASQATDLIFAETPEVQAAHFEARTSVVLIVFDEFSTVSLMDGRQRIDAKRFPNFAALARDATWFRSATTEYHSTEGAVPSLLTGRTPTPTRLPVYAQYPRNIFTLLGKGYRMRVVESLTTLCPRSLCRDTRAAQARAVEGTTGSLVSDVGIVYLHLVLPEPYVDRVPAIDDSWGDFGHQGETEERSARRGAQAAVPCGRNVCEFTKLIDSSRRPTLYLLHTLLPHVPYVYLPSGRRYAVEAPVLRGMSNGRWADRRGALASYQRYLLQVGYTDRALGLILRRLRATGTYHRSLVIATADHGVSFRIGEPRRLSTSRNLEDIAFVPLFVKLPGQRQARIVDSDARTVDVVPTIARVLGITPPWKLDGRPLVGGGGGGSNNVFVIVEQGVRVSAPLDELRARRARALREQLANFGSGPFSRVYRLGPAPALVGRRTADLPRSPSPGSVELDGAALLNAVDAASDLTPTYVTGRVNGLGSGTHDLAVAVNGRIAATTSSFQAGGERFAALVPEEALHAGRNAVEIFALQRTANGIRLQALAGSAGGAVLREREGNVTLETPGQAPVAVKPGALRGSLDVVRKAANWVFTGWAADLAAKRQVTSFLVLADGREVFRSGANSVRPHRTLGEKVPRKEYGFQFELPASVLPEAAETHSVRFFAIRGRVASEPRYEAPYPWGTR